MQATIINTVVYPDNLSKLQSFVNFDDGNGATFLKSYVFSVGSDPLSQIQADVDAYNTANDAASNFQTTVATAINKNPDITDVVVAEPVQPEPVLGVSNQLQG